MNADDVDWWFDTARKVAPTVTVRSVRRSLHGKFDVAGVTEGLEALVANGRAITLSGERGRAPAKRYLLLDGESLGRGGRSVQQ